MPDKPELLPCPFCGATAGEIVKDIELSYFIVVCQKCNAIGTPRLTEEYAAISWNTRADRWIPVSERLPEKVGDYLVRIDDNLRPNRAIKILPYFHSHGWMSESKQFPVTHWMPLPEPPKEVDNG